MYSITGQPILGWLQMNSWGALVKSSASHQELFLCKKSRITWLLRIPLAPHPTQSQHSLQWEWLMFQYWNCSVQRENYNISPTYPFTPLIDQGHDKTSSESKIREFISYSHHQLWEMVLAAGRGSHTSFLWPPAVMDNSDMYSSITSIQWRFPQVHRKLNRAKSIILQLRFLLLLYS